MSSHPSHAADLDLGGQPANGPAWPCTGWGLPGRALSPGRRCALTAPFHPCLCAAPRGAPPSAVCLCGTFPRVSPGRCPRPPCSAVSGLSSTGCLPRRGCAARSPHGRGRERAEQGVRAAAQGTASGLPEKRPFSPRNALALLSFRPDLVSGEVVPVPAGSPQASSEYAHRNESRRTPDMATGTVK